MTANSSTGHWPSGTPGATTEASSTPRMYHTTPETKIVSFVVGSVGLALNLLVLIIIVTYEPLRKKQSKVVFIANLAAIDFIVCLLIIFTGLYQYELTHYMTAGYLPDELLCRLWYSEAPLWGMMMSSAYGIVTLTYERYLSIVYPLWHRTSFTPNKMIPLLMLPWVIGPTHNLIYKSLTAEITPQRQCSVLTYFSGRGTRTLCGVLYLFLEFIVPLVLLLYLYVSIARKLSRKTEIDERTPLTSSGSHELQVRARSRVIKTLVAVSILFIVCWSSTQIYFILLFVGLNIDMTGLLININHLITFTSLCFNPFIYSFQDPAFQQGIVWLVYCWRRNTRVVRTTTV